MLARSTGSSNQSGLADDSLARTAPSNTTERQSPLCGLVRRYLLLAQVSASEWSRNENALLMLSESILGSALAPSPAMTTEAAVVEVLKKRLAHGGADGMDRAIKFSEILVRLQNTFTSNRLWSALYFLLRVAEKNGRSRTTARMADILSGGSVPAKAIIYTPSARITERPNIMMADKPQSEYWKEFQELCQRQTTVPELAFLRDLVFVLQGGDGNLIRFDEAMGRFVVVPTLDVQRSSRALVEKVAECGNLCRRISRSIAYSMSKKSAIRQSFNQALEAEMREYFKLVACFEATVNGAEASSMTLRRALVWFAEYQPTLAFVDDLLREAQGISGSSLISLLYKHRSHGFPEIAACSQRLLAESLRPFYAIVCEFVRFGNLLDAHDEFFITSKSPKSRGNEESPDCPTTDCFELDEARVPSLMTLEVARQALLAGKTRSFLSSLANHMEIDAVAVPSDTVVAEADFDEVSMVTGFVKNEHQIACRQLAELLHTKYSLQAHFTAIRDYIHFARGDFASALIESLSGPLSKPAGSLFRHALVNSLDQALISVCKDDRHRHIRERMDVRIHETTNPKVTGWDVFTLDYKVDFPLNVIINPSAMTEHVRLSHFLWSLRRVHFVMNNCAARIIALQRTLRKNPDLYHDLKRLQMFIMEGAVLARQTCDYSFASVNKCWERFMAKLSEPGSQISTGLDFFVDAHKGLLEDLKASLLIFYNGSIKMKLALVLSDLLKSEAAVKSFERYAALCLEHGRRLLHSSTVPAGTAYRPRASSAWGILPEDEVVLEAFPTHQLRLLSEHRAGFQHCVRQFQCNLDEFFLQLQKESASQEASILRAALDYNGYHARRAGFDQRKYCAAAK